MVITAVETDDGQVSLPVPDADTLEVLHERMAESHGDAPLLLTLQGRSLQLVAKGSLHGARHPYPYP
jgi:hypothetical protein